MPLEVNSLLSVAREVTGDILETMFFSTAAAVGCNHPGQVAVHEEWISSRVRFGGAPSGELRVMLSRELARSIAAAFLGADPEDVTPETEGQVGCELGNMICGAILSRVHPDSRVALTPPELASVTFGGSDGIHQCFETPDGRLSINMHIEPCGPQGKA